MGLFSGIKAIFGFEGVSNTAMKIVDRMAGTDWTPEQQAEFILKHAEVTKHQSPMRRFIAGSYTVTWIGLALLWVLSAGYGRIFDAPNALLFAGDIINFMDSNVNLAMSGILAFYFLMNMRK